MKSYPCHDNRYWSKILLSIIPTPGHEDYGLKIFMLKFYFKVFKDCLPYLFHSFRNKYFNKISLDNMLYFQNELYKF